MMITPSLKEFIASKVTSNDLRQAAEEEGFESMCIDGMRKTYEGITTIDEIFRVSPPEEGRMSEMLSAEPLVEKQAVTQDSQSVVEQFSMGITRPQKILVVDDEELSLRVVQTVLEAANYQVITAQDGELALRLAIEERPDLIISDIIMPEMDGIALTKKLKSKLITRSIPVIILTVKHDLTAEVKGLESGADDYLTKPFQPERLIARIKRLLNRYDE
jgi:PleD family two-component response regulator